MNVGMNKQRVMRIALAIVLVAVVVPIVVACAAMPCCQAGMLPIACLPGMSPAGAITSGSCDMGSLAVHLPDALTGVSLTLLVLMLFGFAAQLLIAADEPSELRAVMMPSTGPPPPEEPLGTRLRI